MPATGYIQVHAYTSQAQMPIKDAAIAITDASGSAIALRLTDKSGQLEIPVPITVPDLSAGQSPDTGQVPYTLVNLYAKADLYEEIEIENLQVFPDTVTIQNLEFIPQAELPDFWNQVEIFDIPTQNL